MNAQQIEIEAVRIGQSMNSEDLIAIIGIGLAIRELQADGLLTHEDEIEEEPAASYQSIGRRVSEWARNWNDNVVNN